MASDNPTNKKRIGVVYLITNTINGKMYVGQTVQEIFGYFAETVKAAVKGCTRKPLLYRAIRKHGPDAFEVAVLAEAVGDKELSRLEKAWILALHSSDSCNGYNLTLGGTGGAMVGEALEKLRKPKSADHRRKMSEFRKGKPELMAQMNTPEARRKKSETLKGRVFSEETIRKMSAAKRGSKQSTEHRIQRSTRMKGSGNPMFGVPMPAGHQEKLQAGAQRWRAGRSPEQITEQVRKASNARWARLTPEQRSEALREVYRISREKRRQQSAGKGE